MVAVPDKAQLGYYILSSTPNSPTHSELGYLLS